MRQLLCRFVCCNDRLYLHCYNSKGREEGKINASKYTAHCFSKAFQKVEESTTKAGVQKAQILKNALAREKLKEQSDDIYEKFEAVYCFDTQFSTYTNAARVGASSPDGEVRGNAPYYLAQSFTKLDPTTKDAHFEFMVQSSICQGYFVKLWGPVLSKQFGTQRPPR